MPINPPPDWILQGNIYEVNVRQYTAEGTFNAFAKHLDRLKGMGVQTLWFMPINPISKKDRKGTLGSYYAVSSYISINPEYGNLSDWQSLVNTIHEKEMKVIIDWVPNHTGADHEWLTDHPDFFVRDKDGIAMMAADWSDTRQLDFSNPKMEESMIEAMKYWVINSFIDGFRCDMAKMVPGSFWSKCIPELKKINSNIFMLAEGDDAYLPQSGFEAIYPWEMFHLMEQIARGEKPAYEIDNVRLKYDSIYPASTIALYFTSNHDENSWNKADYGSFPGIIHAPFAVLTQTFVRSVPLIYSGQEEPVLRAIQFFEKDVMEFKKLDRATFYKTLLDLRKRNPALSAEASFTKLDLGNNESVYAYQRQKNESRILIILNFSNQEQALKITDKNLLGKVRNVFANGDELLTDQSTQIPSWGYLVYEY